jgi:hypothetical protein
MIFSVENHMMLMILRSLILPIIVSLFQDHVIAGTNPHASKTPESNISSPKDSGNNEQKDKSAANTSQSPKAAPTVPNNSQNAPKNNEQENFTRVMKRVLIIEEAMRAQALSKFTSNIAGSI